jgi:hypothetical protein
LVPLVDAAKPQCRVRVDSTGRQTVCSKPSGLLAELGRAQRRSELEAQIDKANAALATGGTVRPANSDAKAVSKYLAAIGLDVSPERVADLLVVLAVLILELGPGACLSLAIAMSAPVAPAPRIAQSTRPSGHNGQTTEQPAGQSPAIEQPVRAALAIVASDIEQALRSAGGSLGSIRALAERLGRPKSTIGAECARLAAAGRLALVKEGRATRIELVARAN